MRPLRGLRETRVATREESGVLRGPANSTASLICQKHTGKFPKVTGKLLLHKVLMKRPTQLDNHRFCHERAARCPPPFFAAWAATRV